MSSFNPYADKKPQQEPEIDSEFKFLKDKTLGVTRNEMKGLSKAMESQEFRDIMSEYMNDISDPKHKDELEKYLTQCEENGELPPNTKLIRPTAGFCLKTTSTKLLNRKEKKFFEQKTFINVTSHEFIEAPRKVERMNNGKRGYTFELPYRVSKGRPDQDVKGDICTTYDVVFNPEVIKMTFAYSGEFLKFVCDTAIDGVNKVVANEGEKVSSDYKVMRKMRCKGGKPASITAKIETSNPIINSMDPSKHETALQKEIMSKSKGSQPQSKLEQIQEDQEDDSEDENSEELKRIEGISEPKFKVVYSYPVDVGECWEPPADVLKDRKFPNSLRVTIMTPFIESTNNADLDINEDTLMFKVPDIYDLMVKFKYKVDPDRGSAKFEKDKKRLVITLPIVGVTEATHEIMRKQKEQFETNMKRISSGELIQEMDHYTSSISTPFETELNIDQSSELNTDITEESTTQSENTHELKKGMLDIVNEETKVSSIPLPDPVSDLKEIKFKEDDSSSDILINPITNNVEYVKEIASFESADDLQKIKKELEIPVPPKEKQIEYIEPMFQQRNDLLFFMFKVPNYKQENVKYFVSSTHLY